jgi:hypothetical protein
MWKLKAIANAKKQQAKAAMARRISIDGELII